MESEGLLPQSQVTATCPILSQLDPIHTPPSPPLLRLLSSPKNSFNCKHFSIFYIFQIFSPCGVAYFQFRKSQGGEFGLYRLEKPFYFETTF